jgi:ubiquinone/menaquinone biosynthesis C-methylase UbiE
MTCVQYGCGLSAPAGWRNFDASPTLRLQRLPVVGRWLTPGRVRFPDAVEYGDVTRRLPLADASCDAVYCSHVLEHLSLADLRLALRETRRVLRSDGVFRGVMPDLEVMIRGYANDDTPAASVKFIRDTLMGVEARSRGLKAVAEHTLGNSHHLWLWDYKGIAAELEAAGFRDIRRAGFGDSGIAAFAGVEEEDRWTNSLGFQCRK